MRKYIAVLYSLIFILSCCLSETSAANKSIEGTIKDAGTQEELVGANVFLLGTSLGASSDLQGKYKITNVPPGTYTIRVSYIGYQTTEAQIQIGTEAEVKKDFELISVAVESQEIIITSQAEGQLQAINQQLASDNIINAVSSSRISELPDANAAESVSRLPGISVVRAGGEGEQVAIRGLAPKYNSVTINGVRLSASNSEARNTDLSMISSNMLDAIQVTKTVTPDMDANLIGGVVNFDLRQAKVKQPGVPEFGILAQGSYNGLESSIKHFNNYKFEVTAENRFLDNKLGIFGQVLVEKKNLSSNELGATYTAQANDEVKYLTQDITISDITRDRKRWNGVLALDYELPEGKIQFANFFSQSSTEGINRQQFYNVDRGTRALSFTSNYTKGTLNSLSNILRFDQQVSILKMSAVLSHSYSENKDPKNWTVSFISPSDEGLAAFGFAEDLDPRVVVRSASHDTSETMLRTVSTSYAFARERNLTASLDFELPLNISNDITSIFKFGGKYQHQKRSYDNNVANGDNISLSSGQEIVNQLKTAFPWIRTRGNTDVMIGAFVDPAYDYGQFLGGDYKMVYPLDFTRMQDMVNYMDANQIPGNISYNYNVGSSITNDYNGQEDISAVYAMATIKLGQFLTVIPGVRFQQLRTEYTAPQGIQGPTAYADYPNELVTVTHYHPYWLPDILVRYKPFEWFDVRIAYTNTVSYPDYASLTPRINVSATQNAVQWNGFNLNPIRSKNYDIYLSFYENTIGLFTAGAFLKQITDLIYSYSFTPPTPAALAEYYPDWYDRVPQLSGSQVTTYVNNSYRIDNYGIELDWQTHFWYLPGPLSGLVLNANFTHIFSEAEYPYEQFIAGRPPRYNDTSYFAPLLYQPDNIVNLSLGYDYEGFSIRVSSVFSSKIFTRPVVRPQLRAYTTRYNRWDIAVRQDLPFPGLRVYCNINNLNSEDDVSAIAAYTGVPSQIQSYGYTIEAGVGFQF